MPRVDRVTCKKQQSPHSVRSLSGLIVNEPAPPCVPAAHTIVITHYLVVLLQGIFGTLFNRSNLFVCRLRKTTRLGKYPVREVLLVTAVTAVLSFPLPYMRMNMGDLIRLMVSRCGPGDVGGLW